MRDDVVTVNLKINGVSRSFDVPPGRRLLDLLRDDAGLTGTKEGCGAGECGACTVLLDGLPIPSCLPLAASCEGQDVTTVEGLVCDGVPNSVQQAMADGGGVQCGFCTPGVIMTATAVVENGKTADSDRLLAGNLCRCTGYRKIFNALDRIGGHHD